MSRTRSSWGMRYKAPRDMCRLRQPQRNIRVRLPCSSQSVPSSPSSTPSNKRTNRPHRGRLRLTTLLLLPTKHRRHTTTGNRFLTSLRMSTPPLSLHRQAYPTFDLPLRTPMPQLPTVHMPGRPQISYGHLARSRLRTAGLSRSASPTSSSLRTSVVASCRSLNVQG